MLESFKIGYAGRQFVKWGHVKPYIQEDC